MYSSKFPFSMESIPQQNKSFGGLSLRFGSVLTGILLILYSILALAQCAASLGELPSYMRDLNNFEGVLTFSIVISVTITHAVTLFLSTIMIIGVLREQHHLIKPWVIWMSIQVSVATLLFIMWSTMSFLNYFSSGSLVVYIVQFVGILIRFYMLILVASFYKSIEEDKEDYERLKHISNSSAWYAAL